jgi:hypothetical protein
MQPQGLGSGAFVCKSVILKSKPAAESSTIVRLETYLLVRQQYDIFWVWGNKAEENKNITKIEG